MSGALAHWEGD